jgi:arylformamidase
MRYRNIIDISLPVQEGMVCFPGNPSVEFTRIDTGSSYISSIIMGSHTGTHIDAPGHISAGLAGVDDVPLQTFIGPCRVLDMTHVKDVVRTEDLEPFGIGAGERILVKTRNSLEGFDAFRDTYVYLDGDAADYVAGRNIALFGIDWLSIKKRGGPEAADQRPHTSLLAKGIVIFEGLQLGDVIPGDYYFIGLPLRLLLPDGAPARAILLQQ